MSERVTILEVKLEKEPLPKQKLNLHLILILRKTR